MRPQAGTIYSPRSAHRALDLSALGLGYEFEIAGNWAQSKKFAKSPWAFACMDIRGSELAYLPWRFIDRAGETVEEHPLIDMLLDFGPEGNWPQDMKATEVDMLMGAAGYWLVDGGELRRLDGSTIEVEADRGGIKAFVETINGVETNRYAREDVVYFREYSPAGDLKPGVAVMDTIKRAVAVEYESALFVEAFFQNDTMPGFMLSTEQTVDDTQINKILAWFRKTFRGSRNRHKMGIADRGLKPVTLTSPLRELALVEIRDQARNDICAGMRVPKILVGAMEDATYANAQEARKFLLEDLIIPRATYYQAVINTELVHRIDPEVSFDFQPELLPILQPDQSAKWDRLSDALERNAISEEFARQQMGWPETAAPAIPIELPAMATELRAFRRKAMNAYRRGESPDVDFYSDVLSDEHIRSIGLALADADSEREIKAVFHDG